MTAIHLVTVAALAILSLAAARPARAQQGAIPPELDMPDATHGKTGITHKSLLKSDVPGNPGQEVIVWDTEYAPRAINPRHYHPAAITFYVVSGTGIWQEDGKAPLTLKAGDSLFVPAGTTHAHWNPSYTESLRFLEFIAGTKDKVRPEPRPHSRLSDRSPDLSDAESRAAVLRSSGFCTAVGGHVSFAANNGHSTDLFDNVVGHCQ